MAPDGLTVEDLVARGRYPHQGLFRQWSEHDEAAVEEALAATATADLRGRPLDELSGGQRQRAWIAMTLAQQTELLLLDEPTTFLDLAHQIDVLDLLDGLVAEHGRTVVMVLHDINQACRYADQLVAVRDGRVHAAGPPGDIVDDALDPRRLRPRRAGHRGPGDRHAALRRHRPTQENPMHPMKRAAATFAALTIALSLGACGGDDEPPESAREQRRRREGVPGEGRAQVRHDRDPQRAEARRHRRLHRPGRGAGTGRRPGRRRRLPRRLQVARAPVGAGGAGRRGAAGRQRPADQLRGRRRAAPGSDHRDQRGPQAGRLRPALADRADRRPVR